MDDEKASLNYDCNYNLFLAKRLIEDMKSTRERQNAIRWLKFIMSSAKNVAEMQLRNDFMYYLVINLQEAYLRPPFCNPPPTAGTLMDIGDLIPGKVDNTDDIEDIMADLDEVGGGKPVIVSKSPDGGAFLSMQPVPRYGSFCYLAITTRKNNQ